MLAQKFCYLIFKLSRPPRRVGKEQKWTPPAAGSSVSIGITDKLKEHLLVTKNILKRSEGSLIFSIQYCFKIHHKSTFCFPVLGINR
jgi:hypothetical protein